MTKPLDPSTRENLYRAVFPSSTAAQISPEQQRRDNLRLFSSRGGIKSRRPAQQQEVHARNLPSQFGAY